MATAKQALSGLWNASFASTSAVASAATAVATTVELVASYADDALADRKVEQQIDALDRVDRVCEDKARVIAERRFAHEAWAAKNEAKAALFNDALKDLKAKIAA